MYGIWKHIYLVLPLLIVVGCEKSTTKKPLRAKVPDVDASVADFDSDSNTKKRFEVNDEEAKAFAENWLKAIENNGIGDAGDLIDWRKIINRALASFEIDKKQKQRMVEDFMRGIPKMVARLANNISVTDYRFVNISRRGGESFVLFRLLDAETRLNYHLMRLRKVRSEVRADQFFIATSGEDFADTFRNLFEPVVKSMNLSGRLSGARNKAEKDMELQVEMNTAVVSKRYKEAIRIYNRMPERLRKAKVPMLLRIKSTDIKDVEAYAKAIDDFLEVFPDDSSAGLMTFDVAIRRKDQKLLKKGYEALSRWTGGDPYLDLFFAANLSRMGQIEKAKEIAASVDVELLGLGIGHEFLLTIVLEAEDHGETLKQLRILREIYRYEFSDLRNDAAFEAFVKSPEFKKWQAN